MDSEKLKNYLIQLAGQVTQETKLEDIYQQLALLEDIDQSEIEESKGEVLPHQEVIRKSKEWLK
ncbi:MAG: hypothetical protein L0Y35_07715 [Flammeovirgaceae bacterium]|nr:hypothetical protein [Flammeovirgaceae bacterium]